MNKLTYALLAAVLIILVIGLWYIPGVNQKVVTLYNEEVAERENMARSLLALTPIDFTVGADDPKLRIVIYSDTDCQFCRKMEPRFTRLMETYPEEVAITYRHYNLPIYPGSRYEHQALECVGMLTDAERYRAFQNNVLLETRLPEATEDFTPSAAELVKYHAPDLAADIDACIEGSEVNDRIKRKVASGATLGVRITPTMFYVDREGNYKMQAGSLQYDEFVAAVNEFLGEGNHLGE